MGWTQRQWDAYWNRRRRRIELYHDPEICFHQWEYRPGDVFQWHCRSCGAWSRKWKPRYSKRGMIFRETPMEALRKQEAEVNDG